MLRGAQQLYAAYKAVGLSLDEFEGPKFQRIAHIREQLAEGRLDASLRRLDCSAARPSGAQDAPGAASRQRAQGGLPCSSSDSRVARSLSVSIDT